MDKQDENSLSEAIYEVVRTKKLHRDTLVKRGFQYVQSITVDKLISNVLFHEIKCQLKPEISDGFPARSLHPNLNLASTLRVRTALYSLTANRMYICRP